MKLIFNSVQEVIAFLALSGFEVNKKGGELTGYAKKVSEAKWPRFIPVTTEPLIKEKRPYHKRRTNVEIESSKPKPVCSCGSGLPLFAKGMCRKCYDASRYTYYREYRCKSCDHITKSSKKPSEVVCENCSSINLKKL